MPAGRRAYAPSSSSPAYSEGSKGAALDYIVFQEFEGMNTQSMRQALPEKQQAWCENLQPIGTNNIKAVPAPAAPIHTINGKTIVKQFYFNFGQGTDYVICITSDGGGYAVVNSAGTTTQFAPTSTFGGVPDITQWGTQRIIIADSKAGYCTWDTHTFVMQGGVSPNIVVTVGGMGYTSPVVAISGGSGSGAAATATQVGGVIISILLTNPGTGYKASDTLTVAITDGGPGTGATATAHPWPFISPNPTTLAVFQGRVFLAQTNVITYSGTGQGAAFGGNAYDDFDPADASGTFTIQDPDLVHIITALRALNNYLYVIGDNSVKQIGNLTVSTSITSFTLVTLSSDQGTIFQNTVISYNRLLLFANTVGVYAVFGSSVEKISDAMDGIFQATDFSQLPVAAVNDINNIHVYLLLLKYKDPVEGPRSIMISYMNKKWFVVSQGNGIKYIATAIVNGTTQTFATSGGDITPILKDQNTNVNIILKTALSSHGNPVQGKHMLRFAVAQLITANNNLTLLLESENGSQVVGYNTTLNVTWSNNVGEQVQWKNNSSVNVNFYGPGYVYIPGMAGQAGAYLGATLSGSVSNYALNAIMLEYELTQLFGSATTQGQK